MIIITAQIHAKENRRNYDWYSRGGAFIEDYQSNVWLEFCNRWYQMASYMELLDDVEAFFTKVMIPENKTIYTRNFDGSVDPMYFYEPSAKNYICPMTFDDDIARNVAEQNREYIVLDKSIMERLRENATRYPNQQF